MPPLQVCSRCVYDTTIPEIVFDEDGVCQFCRIHDEMEKQYPSGPEAARRLAALVSRIKARGRGKDYDCVVGVSGGVDRGASRSRWRHTGRAARKFLRRTGHAAARREATA